MSDDRPDRVYGVIVRDGRVFVTHHGIQRGLPGGVFRKLAEDRKVELRAHLATQLGIEARAVWAQGAFFYRHPAEEREYFSGFYSVWEFEGEPSAGAGEWLSADEVRASLMPAPIRILLTSVLNTAASKTT
ncbi:MAG: hypothetical protein WEC33_08100 [Dehalococcoidia bacterium]